MTRISEGYYHMQHSDDERLIQLLTCGHIDLAEIFLLLSKYHDMSNPGKLRLLLRRAGEGGFSLQDFLGLRFSDQSDPLYIVLMLMIESDLPERGDAPLNQVKKFIDAIKNKDQIRYLSDIYSVFELSSIKFCHISQFILERYVLKNVSYKGFRILPLLEIDGITFSNDTYRFYVNYCF